MLIRQYLFIILVAVVCLVALFIARRFYLKMELTEKYKKIAQGVVFVVPIMIFAFFWKGSGAVYIINSTEEISTYRLLGSTDYTLGNGKVIEDISHKFVNVLNNTDQAFFLEALSYGTSSTIDGYDIVPFSSFSLMIRLEKIDYFLNDKIPSEIRVPLGGEGMRYHLRVK